MNSYKPKFRMLSLACVFFSLQACAVLTGEIDPIDTDTATLVSGVKAALIENTRVDAAAILVSTAAGSITLSGFVASKEERQAALESARASSKGASVLDQLELR